MHDIALAQSPLAAGHSPVRIRIRDAGVETAHRAIVFLHGGWGYDIYPFDRPIAALGRGFRIAIPDRSGYGGSTPIDALPSDFHRRAALETISVMDALELDSPILWGHSDGAIIALLIALQSPARVSGLVVEAAHFVKRKPRSRAFFEHVIVNPGSIGPGAIEALVRDHGDRWRDLISLHARAWLRIGDEARSDADDFYDGRLATLTAPVLVVHGARDPRTEPGELDALTSALRGRARARTDVFVPAEGGHSPHSERATADAVTAAASAFCETVAASAKVAR